MTKLNMKAITMSFKGAKVDEEGNPLRNKETGEILYKTVSRKVKHNAAYFPYTLRYKAEKPTC